MAFNLLAERNGVSFISCLETCCQNLDFVSAYDQLKGTSFSKKLHPIEQMIDEAVGKKDEDFREFVDFVWDDVFMRFKE